MHDVAGIDLRRAVPFQADADQAGFGQGAELAVVGPAVLVAILPHPEVLPVRIGRVEGAIAVVVEGVGQRREVAHTILAMDRQDNFRLIGDPPVTADIEHH